MVSMNMKIKMTDCSKPPRCVDEKYPSSAKHRATMAIPSVWISDGNTKHQTSHLRSRILQELTKRNIAVLLSLVGTRIVCATAQGFQFAVAVLGR